MAMVGTKAVEAGEGEAMAMVGMKAVEAGEGKAIVTDGSLGEVGISPID